ncbi:MSHA biogenesis protein MshI [Aquipseudomonas alcaligenes]|uniref:MSHA biogenesis protein MshI n=1 Tax=Aquipseudomonas alcaligenes TaxID=43263 RepID=A0AA42SSN3_AQUAC|nr:MSHA biogenesis protein MshI [Pseudomonas alcaligenes]MDH1054151.1 MSHA biogenesis protein MshI [Pseudomonas alcaligenes]
MWFAKRRTTADGLLGIETGPEGIALARVQRLPGEAPRLLDCLFRQATPAEQPALLKSLVAERALGDMPVNLVLHPATYQMLLLDAPEVPAEELRDAMRWRVKDLIAEPLEQVVVDAFCLPDDAYRGRSRMAYCAVLSKARMQAWGDLFRQAGLRLRSIDVTEMAFRNLGLLAGAEGMNVALLRLRSSEGLISVQNGADLYMARRIEHGLDGAAGDYGTLTLEIQRSLDYFESQLGKGYINRLLLLLPSKRDGAAVQQAMGGGLAVKLQALDLRELFPGQASAELDTVQQAYCMTAVGAALRQEAD